jgi:acetylornithine deacetylase/succinyl-diaminopimelate desuccinylase-like protein
MVATPGHVRARAYLERRLAEIGLTHYRGDTFSLSYQNTRARAESHNLVGVIPGTDRAQKPVLIGAHYDSIIAAPSADDDQPAGVRDVRTRCGGGRP